ncbi:MAG: aldehyde dehydrogenase family protein [Deltaproteobacteria bacterium]|nr:aldehyde dehydrogenase family protein [Deltaproteobacteria bacterium]
MSIPISLEQHSEPAEQATHIPCVDPATREPLGEVRIDSPEDVDAAVARAKVAQQAWRKTSFEERRKVLRQLLAYTVENKDEICLAVQRDSGKTRENALMGEIWPTCEKFRGRSTFARSECLPACWCTRRRISSITRSVSWLRSFLGTIRFRTSSIR